jgi:hypothetical protein
MSYRQMKLAAGLGAFALLGAACTGTTDSDTAQRSQGTTQDAAVAASEEPTADPTETSSSTDSTDSAGGIFGSGSSGELGTVSGQQGAEDIEIDFTSPDDGLHFEGDRLSVGVRLQDVKLSAELAGKENRANTGHWHLYLDDSLVDMVTGTEYDLSLVNVEPGEHTLRAVPSLNDHSELTDSAQVDEVTFDWDPNVPPADVRGTNFDGEPELEILSPDDGAVVARDSRFDITIDVENFRLNRDLFGKEDLEGYGHWHLNLEGEGEGEELGGMISMGTSETISVPTHGLDPGVHTFIVTLSGNSHAPIQGEIQDSVEITVE